MGVDVLYDPEKNKSCLYSNTTDRAFGPVMDNTDVQEAHDFLELLDDDPRVMAENDLFSAWESWETAREMDNT